jgi:aspartyl-tRNA(Asn)/glutamyl-tRNA(Gln) amidotransferase subunit A
MSNEFTRLFSEVDVLMGPTTPTPAFPHGDRNDDPVSMYLNDIYTIPVNLAGLPAASIQCGFSDQGLPVGLHLITGYLQESKLLNIAHRFQMETDWHLKQAPSVQGASNV